MTEKALLTNACEQFMGRTTDEICNMLLATLDGHLRAIMGKFIVFYRTPKHYARCLSTCTFSLQVQ